MEAGQANPEYPDHQGIFHISRLNQVNGRVIALGKRGVSARIYLMNT